MTHPWHILIYWCLSCFLPGHSTLLAQQAMRFEHYDQTKGLSQGTGYAISQYNNYLWFGTQDGLNRYDGYDFKVYRSGQDTGLGSSFVQALLADSKGRFWVGTGNGIRLYNPNTDRFHDMESVLGVRHELNNNLSINGIFEDSRGKIWITTEGDGIFVLDETINHFEHLLSGNSDITDFSEDQEGTIWISTLSGLFKRMPGKTGLLKVNLAPILGVAQVPPIYSLVVDNDNRLWLGTYSQGIYILKNFPGIKPEIDQHYTLENGQIYSNDITCLKKEKSGNIWIGTRSGGLSIYDAPTRKIAHNRYSHNVSTGIADNHIWSLFEDRQNIMWIGLSNKGIDKYDPLKFRFNLIDKNYDDEKNSLPDNMIFKILGRGNKLYVGTGMDVSIIDLKTGAIRPMLPHKKQSNDSYFNEVRTMSEDYQKNIWMVNYQGIGKFSPETETFHSYTLAEKSTIYLYTSLFLENRNELWIGGQNGLSIFDINTRKWKSKSIVKIFSKRVVRILYRDQENKIWIGTLGLGLFRYDPLTETVIHLGGHSLCPNVRSLLEDNRTLWVGTDCGLSKLNLNSLNIVSQYAEDSGLPNKVIYAALKDENGDLWLSTNKGLARFSPNLGKVLKKYDLNDGLQSNEFNTSAAYKKQDGTMYFGGVNGISYFKPTEIRSNNFIPPVRITQVKVLDSLYNPSQTPIELNHDQNFIDFQFVVFNFSSTSKNTYEYILEGINKSWIKSGTVNKASYTNLPPGTYTFKVKGYNNDGVPSSDIATITIVINPAVYQTIWFKILASLLLVSIGVLLLKNNDDKRTLKLSLAREEALRLKNEAVMKEKEALLQQKIAETEVMALRSQMNPHFIFNCLNSIKLYTLENDSRSASEYLTKFSRLIRMVLENSRLEKISLAQEIKTLRLYMDMEEMRFKGKIRYSINVADDLDSSYIEIPPMLFQPFVENAIWHGLMHKDEGGTVTINIRMSPTADLLEVDIIDNGVGREKSAEYKSKSATVRKSFGMKMTHERIALIDHLFKTSTELTIQDLYDKKRKPIGTQVHIKIPI